MINKDELKGFFADNKTYIIIIALATAFNTIVVSFRADKRTDFVTLIEAYERENDALRNQNKVLNRRIVILEENLYFLRNDSTRIYKPLKK